MKSYQLLLFTLFLALCALGTNAVHAEDVPVDWQPAVIMAPTWPEAIRERNAEMKRRVDEWLAAGEAKESPVYVVYLTCSDQQPFPQHTARLNRVLTEIQTWFAVQHEALGFGIVTMHLERDENQQVLLHEGKLPFTVASRTKENIRETHRACNVAAKELLTKSAVDYDHSFVLVLTTIPDDHGAAPFFGVIQQDRGYCFAVDAPWLDSNYTQLEGPVVWKGKRVGAANSALIGGMAHEMGHGLGLPHSEEPDSYKPFGESLMASGNYTWREELRGTSRGSFLLDTDAMLLIARPPFASRTRDFLKQPTASLEGVKLEQQADGLIKVTGQLKSDIPVHAIKLFDDPPGNNDYNAVAHPALPKAETGQFEIAFQPLAAGGEHALRLVLFHVNGHWSQFQSKMMVKGNEPIDLEQANRDFGGN